MLIYPNTYLNSKKMYTYNLFLLLFYIYLYTLLVFRSNNFLVFLLFHKDHLLSEREF